MPHTIYTSTAGWVPQGNRTVKSFASGLVLIQQDFLAPTGTGDPPELGQPFPGDTTPCIDGAYIYPAPQFSDLGNGFTRCTVTAYGRATAAASYETTLQPIAVSSGFNIIQSGVVPLQQFSSKLFLVENPISRQVLPKNKAPNINYSGPTPKIYRRDGTVLTAFLIQDFFSSLPEYTPPRPAQFSGFRPSLTVNNFGEFHEFIISYTPSIFSPGFPDYILS